ncbi:MAG: cytochrome c biogenesis protein CcsA [Planctomycetes bacterium]|nr:cytochrome c biogenesis protein CcsA [Planctomycetota bacterium]
MAWLVCLAVACASLYLGDYAFTRGAALTLLIVGLGWAGMNRIGTALSRFSPDLSGLPMPAIAGLGPMSAMANMGAPGDGEASAVSLRSRRPILAGAAPGDEGRGTKGLPLWMHHADWSHMIILNMVFIMLFVGIILGAVWADYSWGRPWGWDPKEVFALNTLIIYAMLIHIRFVVKNRGLWTAWMSVAGCAMMAFNWCFVNFYIVGLHSYA